MKKYFILFLLTTFFIIYPGLNASAASNKLIIEGVTTSPEIVQPGDQFKINFKLKNNGTREIQDIIIRLAGIEGKNSLSGFSPLNTTNEIYCGNLQKGRTSESSISMISDPQLKAGTYNLIISLSYREKGGRSYEESRITGVVLTNKPSLLITSLDTPEVIKENMDKKVTLNFVNTGKAVLNDVLLTFSENDKKYTKYYGTIEPGDENEYEQKLSSKGEIKGLVEITYKDEMNKEGKITKDFSVKGEDVKSAEESKSSGGFFSAIGTFFKRLFGLGA